MKPSALTRLPEGARGVVLLGEFGRGKTTLLNALLGESLLPSEGLPMAETVWVVGQAKEARATVRYQDGEEAEIKPDSAALAEWERETGGQAQWISIGLPTKALPAGVFVIEPPGLGEINPAHEGITAAVVDRAVAAILVVDASLAISKVELAWLQRLPGHIQKLLVVINKTDLLDRTQIETVTAFVGEQVAKLELPVRPEILELSARQILAQEHDPGTDEDWQRLKATLEEIASIAPLVVPPQAVRMRQQDGESSQELREIETTMTETPEPPETTTLVTQKAQRQADLAHSRELLLQVVDDRTADILQIVQDGLDAKTYLLEQGLRKGRLQPQEAERELQQWVAEQEQQAYARLIRLFEHTLSEIEHWTEQEVHVQPDLSTVELPTSTPSPQARMSGRARTAGALGSGAAVTAIVRTVFLRSSLGLLASVSVGGLVALAVWGALGRLTQSPGANLYLEDARTLILAGFEQNLQRNAHYLKALIREQFDAALAGLEDEERGL